MKLVPYLTTQHRYGTFYCRDWPFRPECPRKMQWSLIWLKSNIIMFSSFTKCALFFLIPNVYDHTLAHNQSWQLQPTGTLFTAFLLWFPQLILIFSCNSGIHPSCSYFPHPKTLDQISLNPASSNSGNISA
jgi:hypothetical protein